MNMWAGANDKKIREETAGEYVGQRRVCEW